MTLRVVGAGLGRTGTNSLKLALEKLLGGRCYHMYEAAERDEDTPVWAAAVSGEAVDWGEFLKEFVATVDWPACSFWQEIYTDSPDALVLLSTRESAEQWWGSMERTIVPRLHQEAPDEPGTARRREMMRALMRARFSPRWTERTPAIEAYERHAETVRRTVASDRLIDWRTGDGWDPICSALGVAVPDEPFPHVNTGAEFVSRPAGGAGDDQASDTGS
jgi:hypothetical protein